MQEFMETLYRQECLEKEQQAEKGAILDMPKGEHFVIVWLYEGKVFSDTLKITKKGNLKVYVGGEWKREYLSAYEAIIESGNYFICSAKDGSVYLLYHEQDC